MRKKRMEKVEEDGGGLQLNETCVEHFRGNDFCSVTASEYWSINLMSKLKREYPNEVEIITVNKDGSMLVHIPRSWLKLRPPKKISEEHKAKLLNKR